MKTSTPSVALLSLLLSSAPLPSQAQTPELATQPSTPGAAEVPLSESAPPPSPQPPTVPQPVGELVGRVLEAGTRDPLEDVAVMVEGSDSEVYTEVYTDAEGRFELTDLPPGTVTLKLAFPRYFGQSVKVVITAQERSTGIYYLRPREDAPRYAMEVTTEKEKKQTTTYTLQLPEMQKIPGTFGDPVKAVQNLPGMARAPFGLGLLIVRGTGPNDTGTYLDGTRVPILFHFGALTSVFNPSVLDKIDYLPGGYSARYGRSIGGVVDLSTQDFIPARLHGYAEVDLLDSSFYVQSPLREDLAVSFSARRSYIDVLANPIIEATTGTLVRFPRYWDFQVKADYQPSPQDNFQLMLFASDDRFEILGSADDSADSDSLNQALFGTYITQYKAKARWRHQLTPDLSSQLDVALGPEKRNTQFELGEFKLAPFQIFAREELSARLLPTLQLRSGLDLQVSRFDFLINLSADGSGTDVSISNQAWGLSPALYADLDWLIGNQFRLMPGLRVDPLWVLDNYATATVDPRLLFRSQVDKTTVLKGAIGKYSQPPGVQQFLKELNNPDLRSEFAVQGSFGFERRLLPQLLLDVTGYYGEQHDLIVNGPGGGTFSLVAPALGGESTGEASFVNEGQGRNYGVELLLRHDLTDKFFGWVSYTVNRAERKRIDEEDWGLFNFDQTHILNLVASYVLPHGFEASARFRFSSGLPYTPVENAVQDLDSGNWNPQYGAEDSARNPPFHALDVRAEKTWRFNTWKLNAYLDVQNVYNRANPEVSFYNFDFTERLYVQGLPILPVLGVRGEF